MTNHDKTIIEDRGNVAIYREGPGAYAAFRRISWGAVFAGAVTALAVLTLLNLLGLAIGFSTINPTEESNALGGLGIGAAIWFVIANLLALFAGGWVAGRLCGFPKNSTSMLHGFLTWATFTIFSVYVASSAVGSIFNTVGNTLSRTAGLAASGVRAAAQPVGEAIGNRAQNADIDLGNIRAEIEALLEDTNDPNLDPDRLENQAGAAANEAQRAANQALDNPGQADQIVRDYLDGLQGRASGVTSAVDKEAVARVIAERRNVSQAQAMQIVDGWERRLSSVQSYVDSTVDRVQERGPEIAENVAGSLAKIALYAFIGLLLGAVAAAFGGKAGRQLDAALLGDPALAAGDVG